jgi:hypothetical protein
MDGRLLTAKPGLDVTATCNDILAANHLIGSPRETACC